MNGEQNFPYHVDVQPNAANGVTFGFTPRSVQHERGRNGSPQRVSPLRVDAQFTAGGYVFSWTHSPDDPGTMKDTLEDEAQRRLVARDAWLERVADLVKQVELWAGELGWATRRIEKKLDDPYIGKHVVPAVLMQDEVCRILLEPVGRTSPQIEGIVDLYLLPRYDDLAVFYFDNQCWQLRYPADDDTASSALPVSKDTLQQVLDEIKAHAV